MQSIFEDLRKVKSVDSQDVDEEGGGQEEEERDEGVSEICRRWVDLGL